MKKLLLGFMAMLLVSVAGATTIIGTLPYTITNGQPLDATPLMANFNWIVSQVNGNTFPVAVADGGTGSTTAANARAALGAASNGANSDITSLTGLTTALPITEGGTGATTASGARTNFGLGSLATLNTINNSNWSGTVLSAANGGTGNSSGIAASITGQGTLATQNSVNWTQITTNEGSGSVSLDNSQSSTLAAGFYTMFYSTCTTSNYDVQAYTAATGWTTILSPSTTHAYAQVIYSNGSNLRIFNNGCGVQTMYWTKLQ